MGCEYTNSRGQKYYLHQMGKICFFSKDPSGSIDLPPGLKVVENSRTGLPMVKRG